MSDHLSIGEVLALLQEEFPDVTISKIRFLESQGLLDPERTPSGYRKFYEPDIERLRWILRQQRENFLPLKVIKVRLQSDDGTELAEPQREVADPNDVPPDGGRGQLWSPEEDPAAPGQADPEGPVPIWMSDLARKSERKPSSAVSAPTLNLLGSISSDAGDPLDPGPSTVSLTAAELARAAAIDVDVVRELERFGLLAGQPMGSDRFYDGDALVVAQKSAAFLARGLEPRHLRMFKMAVEREAGVLEQVVMPLLKQRNPQSRQEAADLLGELSLLGQQLRNALLRTALREHLQPR